MEQLTPEDIEADRRFLEAAARDVLRNVEW
jgi:hypothetical protein